MRLGLAFGVLLLVLTSRLAAAEPLPIKNQALLLLRILAYDHKLAERVDAKRVTIYVVYKVGATESEEPANEMINTLREIAKTTKLAGNSVQVIKVGFNDKAFDADVARAKGAAVWVAPSLGDSLAVISAASRKHKLLSFTGVPEYVSATLSIGFANVDGKPVISVNLPASRSEGADLDVALLKVAKIVKK